MLLARVNTKKVESLGRSVDGYDSLLFSELQCLELVGGGGGFFWPPPLFT